MVCRNCIIKNETCCTTYSHFITLRDYKRIRSLGKKDFAEFKPLTAHDKRTALYQKRDHNYYYWLTKEGNILQLKKGKKKRCLFLNKKNLCDIYPKRPLICRIYPLWYDKKDKRIRLIIDHNGIDCCNFVKDGAKLTPTFFKKASCSKRLFLKLAKLLDREIEEYREADADEIKKLLRS